MNRTFLATLINAALALTYLNWSREQAERQIDKMQANAFDTPGAESPVTPAVFGGGAALLLIHLINARLLHLRGWQTLVSLVLGLAASIGLLLVWPQERAE